MRLTSRSGKKSFGAVIWESRPIISASLGASRCPSCILIFAAFIATYWSDRCVRTVLQFSRKGRCCFGRASRRTHSSSSKPNSTASNDMTAAAIYLIPIFLIASASATFSSFSSSGPQNASNICIFSQNPDRYPPKCFLCTSQVYSSALEACLNGSTSMPSNITFDQAKCVESNCAINYPMQPAVTPAAIPLKYEALGALIKGAFKGKRSLPDDPASEDNSIQINGKLIEYSGEDGTGKSKMLLQLLNTDNFQITQHIETFASADTSEPVIDYEEY